MISIQLKKISGQMCPNRVIYLLGDKNFDFVSSGGGLVGSFMMDVILIAL